MSYTCGLYFSKIKSMGALKGAYIHNETIEGRAQAPNINPEGTFFSLLDSKLSYEDKWYERMADARIQSKNKRKQRCDAVIALEFVASLPREAKEDVDLDQWAKLTKEWFFNYCGEENVIGFSVHLDEASPHIHVVVVPINEEGHLNQKFLVGGPGKLNWVQTNYAKKLEPLGIRRGVINSKSKHEDIQKFYNILNKTLDEKLPDKLPEQTEEEYKKQIDELYSDTKLQVFKLKKDIGKELKAHKAFEQAHHRGIRFQNKIKEVFKDTADEVFSVIEDMSNEELFHIFEHYLNKKKKPIPPQENADTFCTKSNLQEIESMPIR